MEPLKATSVNSRAEELFVQLFCEAFGPEKTESLQVRYPWVGHCEISADGVCAGTGEQAQAGSGYAVSG